jgi:hypothetical protein
LAFQVQNRATDDVVEATHLDPSNYYNDEWSDEAAGLLKVRQDHKKNVVFRMPCMHLYGFRGGEPRRFDLDEGRLSMTPGNPTIRAISRAVGASRYPACPDYAKRRHYQPRTGQHCHERRVQEFQWCRSGEGTLENINTADNRHGRKILSFLRYPFN